MAIPDLSAYKLALSDTRQVNTLNIGTSTTIAGRMYDMWRVVAPTGVVPSTAVAPDRTTLGAQEIYNPSGGQSLGIVGARFNSLNPGNYIIADRLSHQGGLSATVITPQVTNLPTAALTRYTSGEGVWAALTIYTQIGVTATTVSMSYTNHAGVSGRVSPETPFGATGFREANRCIVLPLQGDDLGVRSVESITVIASTTTTGAFGVTLFKPLYVIAVNGTDGALSTSGFITGSTFGGIARVENDACLFPLSIMTSFNPIGSGSLILEGH